jgi:hypothetical protein
MKCSCNRRGEDKVVTADQPKMKKLSPANTLEMLKKIDRKVISLEELKGLQFDEKTVAYFILQKTKSLFLASSCTENARMTRILEVAHYEAFKGARSHAAYLTAMAEYGVTIEEAPLPPSPDWVGQVLTGSGASAQKL